VSHLVRRALADGDADRYEMLLSRMEKTSNNLEFAHALARAAVAV